jgi:AcrR family transcriptional regulator
VSERDGETRKRVLSAATRLFAANGFKKVTVRQICLAAGANVAAVNYHFGDKLGLYREVLDKAVETMRATTDAARAEGAGKSSEEKLRAYVRVFLHRVYGKGHESWIHQLMAQEFADPTPAMDIVVDQVLKPRMVYLSEVIGDVLQLSPDDERVQRSVMSIQAQCHAPLLNPIARRVTPDLVIDSPAVDALSAHIAEFSLGGARSVRHA